MGYPHVQNKKCKMVSLFAWEYSNISFTSQIAALNAEIATIREEQEADRRVLEERARGVLELNQVLDVLRRVGKGAEVIIEDAEALVPNVEEDVDMSGSQPSAVIEGEMEEGEELENSKVHGEPLPSALNPHAAEFHPRAGFHSSLRVQVLRNAYETVTPADSPAMSPAAPAASQNEDIEMRDAHSTAPTSKSKFREDLEEGEASDDSDLTPPPDL